MIRRDIHISAVQTSLHWEDKTANLQHFDQLLKGLEKRTDLIVLPEMFSTGFSMSPAKLAEKTDGPTLNWMREQATKYDAVITGSMIAEENGNYYNRLLWVRPDGSYEQYSKRHLFRMAGEHNLYAAGDKKLIVDLHGWKICPMVCYDLRFPVWSRNRWTQQGNEMIADYDVLIYVANWPERRSHPWKTLLLARAMENNAYVVGVNRIGNDALMNLHSGDSAIVDFKGEIMKSGIIATEGIISDILSYQQLTEFRKAFPAGMDADDFKLS
jgi:omega-amidase